MISRNVIGKYKVFIKSGFNINFAYRGFIFIWFIGGILNVVIMTLLWRSIYNFSIEETIGGYTFNQMFFYIILSCITSELMYTNTLSNISDDIIDGMIGIRLMKPINYRAQLAFSNVGNFSSRLVVIGIPFLTVGLIIVTTGCGIPFPIWYHLILFFPAIFLASLLYDSISFLIGLLAFKTQQTFGISMISQTIIAFLTGSLIPLHLFPQWAQNILNYTPFPSMLYNPIRLIMGSLSDTEILINFSLSIVWVIGLNLLNHILFRISVKHVVVFGG